MQGKLIRIGVSGAYLVTPLERAPNLDQLKEIVGGHIEAVPFFDTIEFEGHLHRCVAFCNEEGKLEELPKNNKATALWLDACKRQGASHTPLTMPGGDYLVGDIAVVIGDKELMAEL